MPPRDKVSRWISAAIVMTWTALVTPAAIAQGYGLTPVYQRPAAPQLALPGLNGGEYRLEDFKGQVVMINFWATWCPPCVQELPLIQSLSELVDSEKFKVFAVNVGEDSDTIRSFLDKFLPDLTLTILLAQDESLMASWKVLAMPTTYVVDGEGRSVYHAIGPREFNHEHIVSLMHELISQIDLPDG